VLQNFPGLLFYNPPGVIFQAIHADWPIYPTGHGWLLALRSLANFGGNTKFYQVDDIDKCLLFTIEDPELLRTKNKDVYANDLFHVALWHDDLIELKERGLVTGVETVSDYTYSIRKFENFKTLLGHRNFIEDENGNLLIETREGHVLEYHRPISTSSEDLEESKDLVVLPDKSIQLTAAAFPTLAKSLEEGIHKDVYEIIKPLLKTKSYDDAIRKAVLLVEHSIKVFHATDKYGQDLIKFHVQKLIELNRLKTSFIRCYRGELRSLFKFVRNDYMHNLKTIEQSECSVILYRCSDVYTSFADIKDTIASK